MSVSFSFIWVLATSANSALAIALHGEPDIRAGIVHQICEQGNDFFAMLRKLDGDAFSKAGSRLATNLGKLIGHAVKTEIAFVPVPSEETGVKN